MLFIIDSIPLLKDPEDWNPLLQEDIADIRVVRSKDSLALLGYKMFDGVTYIFTKEYRKRPESLKKIPSLKQMEMKNAVWNLHNLPYSGKYIDYYNSGKIKNEGALSDGRLNGELIVYFKNGNRKSVYNYKNGILNGVWNDYYTNGALLQTRLYTEGKDQGGLKMYFINGQIKNDLKKGRSCDTALSYYSTGEVKQLKLIRNGVLILSKKDEEINYYSPRFYQSLNTGDLKAANRSLFEIWKIDSASADTYFRGGLLFLKELRFDKAIAEFDKALRVEPLMREALIYRGLARLKKYQFLNGKASLKDSNKALTSEDIASLPEDEQEKVCTDLQQAEYLDFTDSYVKRIVPDVILNYCRKKGSPG